MSVVHHHPVAAPKEQNRCAALFCVTWLGFFAAIGVITWVLASL